MDLYQSTLSDSGEWSDPINLGAVINTSGFEMNPFLSYDGQELYFRSDGTRETDFFSFDLYVATIVPEPLLGDLNDDTFVDGLDLGILLGNFNSIAPPSGGELNGSDPVDGLDLGIFLGAWAPAPPGGVSVPEPTTAALALAALCLAMSKRRI